MKVSFETSDTLLGTFSGGTVSSLGFEPQAGLLLQPKPSGSMCPNGIYFGPKVVPVLVLGPKYMLFRYMVP